MSEATETKPVIMRITAVYEYELVPDLTERQAAYGATDPAECAKVDAGTDDPDFLIAGADLKSFTIKPVTEKELVPANDDTLTVGCPYCHARPGQWCKDFAGGSAHKLHAKRIKAAMEAPGPVTVKEA
jgi:hypothetical protein